LTDDERSVLREHSPGSVVHKSIIKESDDRIDKVYTIYSYNGFISQIESRRMHLDNCLLIIDEIQNLVSAGGKLYTILRDAIMKAPQDLRVVLMSATPMFDKPSELALILNLLRMRTPLPEGSEFNETFIKETNGKAEMVNKNLFLGHIKGYISYFRGANPISFPKLKLEYIKCEMDPFQYRAYVTVMGEELRKHAIKPITLGSITKLPNDFYIGTRMISNITFPNNNTGDIGLESLTKRDVISDLSKYSTKYHTIVKKIEKCKGKVIVYSNFRGVGGLGSFIRVLEYLGYSDHTKHGTGPKRFGVFSGEETMSARELTKSVYNNKNNLHGEMIKIMLLSPAAREGLSLFNVEQLHIMEPYWNMSRIAQILGRAVRYCSHKDLPASKRFVDAYIYIATHPNEKETVDQRIVAMAELKSHLISEFENVLKIGAVDCELFQKINDVKCKL
jgi:hypothetical protein